MFLLERSHEVDCKEREYLGVLPLDSSLTRLVGKEGSRERKDPVLSNNNNRNTNINCISGFYLQVAKPTLHQLATDSIDETLGISVVCENVTKDKDMSSNEYNVTIFFKLTEASGKKAKVTIHSHHSSRLVQSR